MELSCADAIFYCKKLSRTVIGETDHNHGSLLLECHVEDTDDTIAIFVKTHFSLGDYG